MGKCKIISDIYDFYLLIKDYALYSNYHSAYSINNRYTYTYLYADELFYIRNYPYYPCQEAKNLGTSEKPIYSCTKCYSIFEYDKAYQDREISIKIINPRNNVSSCIIRKKEFLKNCIEAINKTKDGIEKYDCLKCYGDTKLKYDKKTKIHYCENNNMAKKCMVKYCKVCQNGNNFFCSECISNNYIINKISGKCVEKSRVVPSITWKDIYKLEKNNESYVINYQIYNGPSLKLRGITTSQISKHHAFLIYLNFKLNNLHLRNLEEKNEIVILPAVCEVKSDLEESQYEVNIVDYECFSKNTNETDLTNYELENITEGDNI